MDRGCQSYFPSCFRLVICTITSTDTLRILQDTHSHPTLIHIISAYSHRCTHIHSIIPMHLCNLHILNPWMTVRFQINIPENSGINGLRAPVPSKHTVRLPDQLVSFHSTAGNIVDLFIFFILIIFDIFEYGTEYDPDLILPGMKKFFYIQFPDTVHIVCRPGFFSIDINIRQCIQSLTDQNLFLFFQSILRNHKRSAKFIVLPEQFPRSIFIGAVKRIFDLSGPVKSGKHRSRNLHLT